MMLRLLVVLAIVGLIVLAFTPRLRGGVDPEVAGRALAVAARQTLFGAAAVIFVLIAGFGFWHGWRHGDRVATLLGATAIPLSLAFAWLSRRAARRVG
jgi:hypothetical protein